MKNENDTGIEKTNCENLDEMSSDVQAGPDRVNRKSQIVNSSESEIANSPEPNPQSAIANPQFGARRSTSKISRLPASIRNSLNQMIDDGLPYEEIIRKITDLGYDGITHQNLARWKSHGFQDWLDHKDHLEEMRIRTDGAADLVKELDTSSGLSRASEILISMQLYQLLLTNDRETDPKTIAKNTASILQLSRALGIHLSERTRRDRLEFDLKKHQDKVTEPERAERKRRNLDEPLTPAERLSIIRRVDELLGIKLPLSAYPTGEGTASSPVPISSDTPQSTIATPQSTIQAASPPPQSPPEETHPEPLRSLRLSGESDPQSAITNPQSISPESAIANPQSEIPADSAIQPASAIPLPELSLPYPPHPIDQPDDSIPVLNKNGIIVAWETNANFDLPIRNTALPHQPIIKEITNAKYPEAVPFRNRHEKIVCWLDRHRLAPGASEDTPVRGFPHQIPVLDRIGRIIAWSKEPDGPKLFRPSLTATPLIAEYAVGPFAWLDETA